MASETWADAQFDMLEAAYDEVPIEAKARIAELESLVAFMEPFFLYALRDCGCPDGYFEPHGCDDGCKALNEVNARMAALGLQRGDAE